MSDRHADHRDAKYRKSRYGMQVKGRNTKSLAGDRLYKKPPNSEYLRQLEEGRNRERRDPDEAL